MGRILIVDDDELLRDLCAHLLGEAGYEVEKAEHGGQAIARLEQRPFDVVVSDLLMPVREGIETILEIRRRWPEVRVIAMSGGASRLGACGLLDLASGLGAHRTLPKAIVPELLVASVREQLSAAAASESVP